MVTLSVGEPPEPVTTLACLDDARAFVQARAEADGKKCVERTLDDGRTQFIVKAHETEGPAGLLALLQATVYEVSAT